VLIGSRGKFSKRGAGKEPSVAINVLVQNTFKYVVA
jgi:hypothetical protein